VKSRIDKTSFEKCSSGSRLFGHGLCIFVGSLSCLFTTLVPTFNSRFPKHFFFANFRCLQCGSCCRYYVPPIKICDEEIERWIREGRGDILGHVWCFRKEGYCAQRVSKNSICADCRLGIKQIERRSAKGKGCPFLRRVAAKPYHECVVHNTSPETCLGYLCQKSLPVAHLNWKNVDELIAKLGLPAYRKLTAT